MNKLAQVDFNAIQSNALPGFKFGGNAGFGTVITQALPMIFFFAGALMLILIILGGISMMTSRSDPKALSAAQGRITNAILGFVVVFIAYWATQFAAVILGLKQIQDIFKF